MQIDIFADLACPWCYIGWHRLQAAVATYALSSERFQFAWRPFQINPDVPAEGLSRTTYLQLAYGSLARAEESLRIARRAAREDGLALNLDAVPVTPNTLDAHRLVLFAAEHTQTEPTVTRLFAAYFQESRDIGDSSVLLAIAGELGLDPDGFARRLAQEDDFQRIRAHEEHARHLNLRGVPCFIVAGQYVLAGAQEPKTFKPLFDLARHNPRHIS